MSAEPHEIREYLGSDGSNLFRDWLRSLKDRRVRARIRARLNGIRLGNFGDCNALGDAVYELRLHLGPGYRVYFGKAERTVVLLLWGGLKKTQARDVETAKRLWREYERRTS